MKTTPILLLLLPFFFNCHTAPKTHCETPTLYKYDTVDGVCKNCDGEIGFNIFNINKIRQTKNAECVKIPKIHLIYLLDTTRIANFNKFGNHSITGYNFKGSTFEETYLYFNTVKNARLEGADLSKLSYGYAHIYGSKDAFTIAPKDCTETANGLHCNR